MADTRTAPVIAITGLGGMGRSIARRLGSGHQLLLADYDAAALAALAVELRGEGHAVTEFPLDVSDADAVRDFAAAAHGLGRLRALIHTAGVSPGQAQPEQIFRVNIAGTAYLLDAFEPYVEQGTVAICVSSIAGHQARNITPEIERLLATTPAGELLDLPILDPSATNVVDAYQLSKRGVHVRVQARSIAWGQRGGRVLSLSPGFVSTPMGHTEMAGPAAALMREMIDVSAAGRAGTADDIAAVVDFLVSQAASYVCGTDVLVDGGTLAGQTWGA